MRGHVRCRGGDAWQLVVNDTRQHAHSWRSDVHAFGHQPSGVRPPQVMKPQAHVPLAPRLLVLDELPEAAAVVAGYQTGRSQLV